MLESHKGLPHIMDSHFIKLLRYLRMEDVVDEEQAMRLELSTTLRPFSDLVHLILKTKYSFPILTDMAGTPDYGEIIDALMYLDFKN